MAKLIEEYECRFRRIADKKRAAVSDLSGPSVTEIREILARTLSASSATRLSMFTVEGVSAETARPWGAFVEKRILAVSFVFNS